VHYDVIWRNPMRDFLTYTLAGDETYLIYDESHRIKAPGGKASRAADAFEKYAARVWAGSGSFMAHSKLDVYAQARAIDKGYFGTNFAKFRNRYAIMGGFEGRQVVGWQNEDDFNDTLAQFCFFADTDDVLDLPPVQHFVEPVELGAEAKRVLRALTSNFEAEIADGTITAANALTKLLRQQQATSGHAVLDDDGTDEGRKVVEIDTAKKEALAEILRDLPPHEKVVVFARFTHDLAAIKEVVEDSGRVYGEVSGSREDLTNDATMPEHIDVLGVQIQSGSEAVDFTAARYAIYYSLGFSLKDYEQSLRRVHRPGQTRETFYYHLIAEGTVDEKVYSALAERKAVIQSVIDYVKGEGDTK
jgi:SNF2 family DNA or RNA helicase